MNEIRRAWTFLQQRGICYLQITAACRAGGGDMRIEAVGHAHPRYASCEHLFARKHPVPPELKLRRGEILLLACSECNGRKAADAIATPAQIGFAVTLYRLWQCRQTMSDVEAFKTLGVGFIDLDLGDGESAIVIDRPLPVDLPCTDQTPIGWIKTGDEKDVRAIAPGAEYVAKLSASKRKGKNRSPSEIRRKAARRARFNADQEKQVKAERDARQALEREEAERRRKPEPHPRLPAAGYDKPLSVRLREEEERRAAIQQGHAEALSMSQTARGILAAFKTPTTSKGPTR
jgi:hypothetical protein